MREKQKKEIELKVKNMCFKSDVKANLKYIKTMIREFDELSEEEFYDRYCYCDYSLLELKHYSKLLNKKLKGMEE